MDVVGVDESAFPGLLYNIVGAFALLSQESRDLALSMAGGHCPWRRIRKTTSIETVCDVKSSDLNCFENNR